MQMARHKVNSQNQPRPKPIRVLCQPADGGYDLKIQADEAPGSEVAFALLAAGVLIIRDIVKDDGSLKGEAMAVLTGAIDSLDSAVLRSVKGRAVR
jgi:hypothetical protein